MSGRAEASATRSGSSSPIANPGGGQLTLRFSEPGSEPIRPLTEYAQKVVRMRQRGLVYPYEIVRLLMPPRDAAPADFPPGEFQELDLDADGRLAPVDRPPGRNVANVVVGLLTNSTPKHLEGMTRVLLMGDPDREMGSFAEPECRRIIAVLDLAESPPTGSREPEIPPGVARTGDSRTSKPA